MTIEHISKIDIACRHLDTAITLWFQESDPVSVHLLACASHQIIHDIIHASGGKDPFFDSPYIKSEFKIKAKNAFHQHYNFFKHADRDPNASIEFNSSAPEGFIVYSILGLEQLSIKHKQPRTSFMVFFTLHNPTLFGDIGTHPFFKTIPSDELTKMKNLTKKEFFELSQKASVR